MKIRTFKSMFIIGERKVFESLTGYIGLEKDASKVTSEMFLCNGENFTNLKEKVKNYEKEGDNITFDLKSNILEGAISPTFLDTFLNLIEKFDNILDLLYFISREIARFHLFLQKDRNGSEKVICNFYKKFVEIINVHLKALDAIDLMLNANSEEEIIKSWSEIINYEEGIDDIKDNLLDTVYSESGSLHYLVFIHLVEIIHKLDDLLDTDRDISELILNVVYTVSK
ncbi:MAG: DUF47 family protein [Thermoplasmata archaeon]